MVFICFCLYLHKLAPNKPGKNLVAAFFWYDTNYILELYSIVFTDYLLKHVRSVSIEKTLLESCQALWPREFAMGALGLRA